MYMYNNIFLYLYISVHIYIYIYIQVIYIYIYRMRDVYIHTIFTINHKISCVCVSISVVQCICPTTQMQWIPAAEHGTDDCISTMADLMPC